MAEGSGDQGFLPPEPSGREPDLGAQPAPPAEQSAPQPPPQPTWQPPPQSQPPPPQGWQPPPPGWTPPPPGWQPQAPPPQQPPWVWQPQPQVPDNGAAVAGFVLSLVAAGLLVLSAGLSSIVSVICAALGIFYSRRGRARVDAGETPKHRGLAQAGYIVGIITLVLAVLATLAWIAIFASDGFWDEIERDLENSDPNGFET